MTRTLLWTVTIAAFAVAAARADEPLAAAVPGPITRDQMAQAFDAAPMSALDALGDAGDWQEIAYVLSRAKPGRYDANGVVDSSKNVGVKIHKVAAPESPVAGPQTSYFFSWIYQPKNGQYVYQSEREKAPLALENGSARLYKAAHDEHVTSYPAISCGNCEDDPGPDEYDVHHPWMAWEFRVVGADQSYMILKFTSEGGKEEYYGFHRGLPPAPPPLPRPKPKPKKPAARRKPAPHNSRLSDLKYYQDFFGDGKKS